MTARDITATLAPLLELLELEQPRVVTKGELRTMASEADIEWPVEVVVRRLRERGWLLNLQTRGAWEFAPAVRAGALGAGDPLIELRAALRKNPDLPLAIAAESAAYRLGFSSRRPDREVVGGPKGLRLPKALQELRLVHWATERVIVKDSLPVWSTAPLIAFMASQPSAYRDWPNVGDWIVVAANEVTVDDLGMELEGRSRAAWIRAAYLMDCGGRPEEALGLVAAAPSGTGPYYMGRRAAAGRYVGEYDLIDSTGLEVAGSDH